MKNQLLNSPITFPKNLPEGYQYLEDGQQKYFVDLDK